MPVNTGVNTGFKNKNKIIFKYPFPDALVLTYSWPFKCFEIE